jgi:hypothetical protein
LAVVLPPARNAGKLVRVVELAPRPGIGVGYSVDGVIWEQMDNSAVWICESLGSLLWCPYAAPVLCRPFSDNSLQPLRDNPGEDEMLSIARKNAHDSAITEQQERLTRLLEEVPKQ